MSDVKFSAAQVDALRSMGKVNGDKLTVSLAWLAENTSATRIAGDAKKELFSQLIGMARDLENGVKLVTPKMIRTLGLPGTYVTASTLWAGIGEASEYAFGAGFRSEYDSKVDDETDALIVRILLHPLTPEDRELREKRRAEVATKRKERASAAAPVVPSTDAGSAEPSESTDDPPSVDTGSETK